MPTQEPESSSAAEAHAARQDANTQWYLQTLHDLITLGSALAHQIHQDATTPTPEEPAPAPLPARAADPTAAFSRIALCIRRTVLLAQHLNALPPASLAQAQQAAQAAAADDATRQAALRHRFAARKRILRIMEDNIARDVPEPQARVLHRELLERLEAPELDEEIATRPIADIVSDLLGDFGLYALRGKRRTPDDAALLCARAAKPPHTPEHQDLPVNGEDKAAPAHGLATLLLHPARTRGKPRLTDPV